MGEAALGGAGVGRAFMHKAARPVMVKHEWGEKGAPRGTQVSAQEGARPVQAQRHPRAGCGSPGRGKGVAHVGWGRLSA